MMMMITIIFIIYEFNKDRQKKKNVLKKKKLSGLMQIV